MVFYIASRVIAMCSGGYEGGFYVFLGGCKGCTTLMHDASGWSKLFGTST